MSEGMRRIKSVDRTFEILREVGAKDATTVSEVAEAVGLSPGTVHTHLSTLRANGFVQQDGKRYRLGPGLIPLSERMRSQTVLYRAGRTEVDKLAHEYDAVAHLVTEYEGKVVILHETFGEDAVGQRVHTRKRDQARDHMHCTAAGKSILAHLPRERVEEIIESEGLPAYTPHTVTDEAALFDELERIRERRYAVNHEEVVHGNRGIGAPVLDEDDAVVGAISISGPANNWCDERFEDELAEAVIRAANSAEINIHTETQSL
ncbi:MAG: IclR family transcriptional regulator [Haloarculaceae archaeon]